MRLTCPTWGGGEKQQSIAVIQPVLDSPQGWKVLDDLMVCSQSLGKLEGEENGDTKAAQGN